MSDNEDPGLWVRIYNRLVEMGEEGIAARILARRPNLWDYDERGNYVGKVWNENGWAP